MTGESFMRQIQVSGRFYQGLPAAYSANTFGAGAQLDEETKQRICDYLVNPTPTAWSGISGIIVNNRSVTLWQAVRRVDPSFPATGRRYEIGSGRLLKEWERIPHPDLVLKAIERARNEGRCFAV